MSAQTCRERDACPDLRVAKADAAIVRRKMDDMSARLQLAEQSAMVDPLTGAYNRRGLEQRFIEEAPRARRHGYGLCVVYIDVDRFKEFNDRHGHDTGDRVLIEVVGTIRKSLRASDVICRDGGDEFVVVLPEVPSAQVAGLVAERIRERIEALLIESCRDGSLLGVTVSIGVAELSPEDTLGALKAKADRALSKAKEEGRNCAFVFLNDGNITPADKGLAGQPAGRNGRRGDECDDDPPTT